MRSPLRHGDPRSLGGYELLARLGEGGMGSVFLGRRDDGPLVAIKIIKSEYAHEEEFRGRFRSEVKRARQVPPFCTAAVLDADPEHRTPYLVVEYVDGPRLDEVVAREGPLADSRLHGVAVGVATALTAIHGAGVIHRDLKPGNVLFALGTPKVIDFGIARALEVTSQHTHPDQMVGRVAYMAPERFDGIHRDITPAADVFAWGAVIAYAGTGRTPFRADSPVATAARILTQPPDLNGLTGPVADLVALALAKDPADRPTAHELLNLLLAQNTDPGAAGHPHTLDPRLRQAAEEAQLSGSTRSIVKVLAYYPESKSIVVEPVLFMTGDEHCRTFQVKPSADAPCERAWVTEDSRMSVTLPTSAAPKITGTLDDPQRCGGDPVIIGTCRITAGTLAERVAGGGLAEVSTTDGTVLAIAEVYLP